MPMELNDLPRFERVNNVAVNVFRMHGKELLPVRVSKKVNPLFHLDLLLLQNQVTFHYFLIKNLCSFVTFVRGKRYRSSNLICRNCFHVCSSSNVFQVHTQACYERDAAVIVMPDMEHSLTREYKYQARYFNPLIIYFDFESILEKTDTSLGSKTTITEKHKPCAYSLFIIEHFNPEPIFKETVVGLDCVQKLLATLIAWAKQMYALKRQHKFFKGTPPTLKSATDICWICGEHFQDIQEKNLDHCHYSVRILG